MKFHIKMIDKQFLEIAKVLIKEFDSLEMAEDWCSEQVSTGYAYNVDYSKLEE